MNKQQTLMIASLVLACGLRAAPAAASAPDSASAETAVRKADAAWAAAASSGNIDAWMAYLAADAVVRLPGAPLVGGADAARRVVTRLLGAPQASVEWHGGQVDVAPSGDLAQVQGAYLYEHDGTTGAPLREHGRLVEIWRKQADGTWKCSVASWLADGSAPAATIAPTVAAPVAPASAALAPVTPASAAPAPLTKYGDAPVNYLQAIRQYFQEHLKDPESVQYQEVSKPEQGYLAGMSGGLLMHDKRDYGWLVKASINARNAGGDYVGLKTYQFLFRGEKMVRATSPLPDGEMVN